MILTAEHRRKLANFLMLRPEIQVAYLFGSQARETPSPMSDIDIGLLIDTSEVDDSGYGYRATLTAELMMLTHSNAIDLIILNDASPLLAHRAVRDGVVLHSKNEPARIAFEVKTLKVYIDTKPLRRIQNGYLRKSIKT